MDAIAARKSRRRWQIAGLIGAWLGLIIWLMVGYAPLDEWGIEAYRPFFLPAAALLTLWWPISGAVDWLRLRRVNSGAVYFLLAVGSALLGEWSDAVLILGMGTLVCALQSLMLERARQPVTIWQEVLSAIESGPNTGSTGDDQSDRILVPTNKVVPFDGFVADDQAVVASFWAESFTANLELGDPVFAGDINLGDPFHLTIARRDKQTVLSRAVSAGQEALTEALTTDPLIVALNRWSQMCTVVAVGLATVLPLWGASLQSTLPKSMSLVALAVPGAWAVAAKLPYIATAGALLRRAIIPIGQPIRAILSQIGRIRLFALVNVTSIHSRQALVVDVLPVKPQACSPNELLAVAAATETAARAGHPYARAICRAARNEKIPLPDAEQGKLWPRLGVSALVDGHRCLVGNEALMRQHGLDVTSADHLVARTRENNCEPVYCAAEDHVLGVIGISVAECQEWPRTRARLHRLGVKTVLLSGSDTDRQRTAWLAGNDLEVTLLGGQEIPTLRTWVGPGAAVSAVADVEGESSILRQADVGIGLGPEAILKAEGHLALPKRNLGDLPWLIVQARRLQERTILGGSLAVLSRLVLTVMVWRGYLDAPQVVLLDGALAVLLILSAWRLLGRKTSDVIAANVEVR